MEEGHDWDRPPSPRIVVDVELHFAFAQEFWERDLGRQLSQEANQWLREAYARVKDEQLNGATANDLVWQMDRLGVVQATQRDLAAGPPLEEESGESPDGRGDDDMAE
jgi:hypothetical protein